MTRRMRRNMEKEEEEEEEEEGGGGDGKRTRRVSPRGVSSLRGGLGTNIMSGCISQASPGI